MPTSAASATLWKTTQWTTRRYAADRSF